MVMKSLQEILMKVREALNGLQGQLPSLLAQVAQIRNKRIKAEMLSAFADIEAHLRNLTRSIDGSSAFLVAFAGPIRSAAARLDQKYGTRFYYITEPLLAKCEAILRHAKEACPREVPPVKSVRLPRHLRTLLQYMPGSQAS